MGTRRLPLRPGFTLLELILALGLSVLVIAAIGMAIDLNLRALDSRRMTVEQAQLARAVLRLMADDLRSAVQQSTIDYSKLSESVTSAATSNLDSIKDTAGQAGITVDDPAKQTEKIAKTTTPPPVPGLYGNQYEMQVDVSRLPRVDQYDPNFAANAPQSDIASDVKTVAYFLRSNDTGDSGSGLVRRELDRAVTEWSSSSGNGGDLSTGELLAPEATALEFRYFDGEEWLAEWDSDAEQGLPMAVEISLAIGKPTVKNRSNMAQYLTSPNQQNSQDIAVYRMVVHLPIAEPAASKTPATTETDAATSSTGANQ